MALEDEIQKAGEKRTKEIFERARTLVAEHDIEIVTEVGYGNPAKRILDTSENFETVVIGIHGGVG